MKTLSLVRTKLSSSSPIGVFDSGLGGLTVLKSLEDILPNESNIYFGDTAHVPYGTKSDDMIIKYSEKILDFFISSADKISICFLNSPET